MGTFIYFTDEQKHQANEVDLVDFLRRRGEKFIPSGQEYRLASDHSVTVRGNEWFDHATRKGGHAISFVQQHCGLSYPEAVTLLLDGEQGQSYASAEHREEPTKPFVLPSAHKDMRRVYAYLMKHRHIDRAVIVHFAKAGLLYEDAKHHNCVFVGVDENGIPRHAHKRSTNSFGKLMRRAVIPATAFTISDLTGASMCLRLPSIFCPISPCILRTGSSTAMWPAVGLPRSR